MTNKTIYTLDIMLIVATSLVLLFLIGYSTPLIIAPIEEENITQSQTLFTISNTETLLIDDNINFTSPEIYSLKDNLEITLEPGTYYLKFLRPSFNQINTLNLNTQITLEFQKQENIYNIINAGENPLIIESYDRKNIIEKIELLPKHQIKNIGEQK